MSMPRDTQEGPMTFRDRLLIALYLAVGITASLWAFWQFITWRIYP